MTTHRLDIDTDKNVDDITTTLVLFASAIFNEKCPQAWAEAMTGLEASIRKHVADNDELRTA
jgi:hypothetical protein